jgi:hypothetical protein
MTTIVVIIAAMRIIYKKATMYNIIKYVVLNGLIKGLPLLVLYQRKSITVSIQDIYFGLILFIAYNVYLHMNDTNFIDVYRFMADVYIDSKPHQDKRVISKVYDNLAHLLIAEPNVM